MTTRRVRGFGDLLHTLGADQTARQRRLEDASARAARAGVPIVKRHVPVAFGELRESVHAEGTKIVVDAPHAAPVEVGSRPHWAPIGPLLRWVKLRAAQGLLSERERGRLPGKTTSGHAASVAAALGRMESGGALDIEAPMQIARAIQRAIAAHGTKPAWFARQSLPELRAVLRAYIQEALR
jgi:hypothetical protein